ncbi:MAG: SRPBCC family protein [Acidimicrobiales bacterium]
MPDEQPHDEVSLHIEAPADRIYEIVTDIAGMGRLSPECTGGRWLDGAIGPAVGARFKGSNKRGIARWSTTNEVVEADPGRAFSFETQQSAARWSYRLQPEGTGTLVTETRELYKKRPTVATIFTKVFLGGDDSHDDELRKGMRQSLERLKALAEG